MESEGLSRRRGAGLGRKGRCVKGTGFTKLKTFEATMCSKAFPWVKPSDLISRIETDARVPARMDVPFPIETW